MNTKIFFGDKNFDIGCKVIKWDDPKGYSFYPSNKYLKFSFEEAEKIIKSFTLHHSVTYKAKDTYNALIARKLSVNFIIDDDCDNGYATLYQCLDLKDGGYSQKGFNDISRGCEISYRPEYYTNKDLYNNLNRKKFDLQDHPIVEEKIHGVRLKVFGPSIFQIKTCIAMMWGISELLGIEIKFPKEKDYIKTVIKDPSSWNGFLNHYNLERQKIDAAGLDLEYLEEEVKKRKTLGY